MSGKPARKIYLHSCLPGTPNTGRGQRRGILRVDGRTIHARLLRDVRKAVLAHIVRPGHDPTIAQRSMAERIAQLELRLAVFDQRFVDGKIPTDLDNREYLAATNSLRLAYQAVGFDKAAPKFADLLKKRPYKAEVAA